MILHADFRYYDSTKVVQFPRRLFMKCHFFDVYPVLVQAHRADNAEDCLEMLLQMVSFYLFNKSRSIDVKKLGRPILDPFGLFKRLDNEGLFKLGYRRIQTYPVP